MPQFVRPPIFDVPYGGSLGGALGKSVSDSIYNYMEMRDREEERNYRRRKELIKDQIASEDRLINLAPLLPGTQELPPTPMPPEPADPELGLPEQPSPSISLGRVSRPPLLTQLTLPGGEKMDIPPVMGEREKTDETIEYERNKGTIVLTPEAWEKLPPIYKEQYRPGERIDKTQLGAIGIAAFNAAARKTEAEIRASGRAGQTKQAEWAWDRQMKIDRPTTDEERLADPMRYGPPREARNAAAATSATTREDREADRKAAAEAKAAEKKEARDKEVANAADQIANGVPIDAVPASVRSEASRVARAQGARIYRNQGQKDDVIQLESIKKQAQRLKQLLSDGKVSQYFGPAMSWITTGMMKAPEVPLFGPPGGVPDEVREAASLMWNLSDRNLRSRSGANINPKEFGRIAKFSPDPWHQLRTNMVNLDGMMSEIDGIVNNQLGVKPGEKEGTSTIPPSTGGVPGLLDLMKEYGGTD